MPRGKSKPKTMVVFDVTGEEYYPVMGFYNQTAKEAIAWIKNHGDPAKTYQVGWLLQGQFRATVVERRGLEEIPERDVDRDEE